MSKKKNCIALPLTHLFATRGFPSFLYLKVTYSITIDGKEVGRWANMLSAEFDPSYGLEVFAGDSQYRPADASYKNLVWERPFGRVTRSPEIVHLQ